ncbi:uncharacterized protein LOC108742221 [Agrilus planipennis]|uniref:Uncharacterized protein LOC108742221 n=1 Tax=Agrilus planipennis TaxID=224129 RepID=A0A1W4XK25_AGRPL|nr:uncharacterized protein LOC108742221 [Agrilus planipennis]
MVADKGKTTNSISKNLNLPTDEDEIDKDESIQELTSTDESIINESITNKSATYTRNNDKDLITEAQNNAESGAKMDEIVKSSTTPVTSTGVFENDNVKSTTTKNTIETTKSTTTSNISSTETSLFASPYTSTVTSIDDFGDNNVK